MAYDAFISYSHAVDGRLAPELESALERFAKPFYRLRALRVFRDQTNLSLTPALWSTIEKAMGESAYFVLLASPEAAASQWVRQEVAWWLRNRSVETLFLVLTEGELVWDDAAGCFEPDGSTALPPDLAHRFAEEPLYTDLRWARRDEHLSLRHPEFRSSVARLAAPIHGVPLDEIAGREVREHRRTRRIINLAVASLASLTIAALFFAYLSWRNAREAERRGFVSLAQALVAHAIREHERGESERALLLAWHANAFNEAGRGRRIAQVDAALRTILTAPEFGTRWTPPGDVRLTAFAFSSDGRWLAVASDDQRIHLLDLAERTATEQLEHRSGNIRALSFGSQHATFIAAAESGKALIWRRPWSGTPDAILDPLGASAPPDAVALSADGSLLAAARPDGTLEVIELLREPPRRVELCCHEGRSTLDPLAFDRTGRLLASGAKNRTVRLWSLERPGSSPLVLRGHDGPIAALAFDPTGRLLAVGTKRVLPSFLDVMRLGNAAAELIEGGEVVLWDLGRAELEMRRMGGHEADVESLAFDREGGTLASAGGGSVKLWRWADADRPREREISGYRGVAAAVAFSPDDRLVASLDLAIGGMSRSSLRIVDRSPAPGSPRTLVAAHNFPVLSLGFDPSGQRMASATDDVQLWNTREWKIERTFDHGEVKAVAVAFSPDGATLATGTKSDLGSTPDHAVRLWELDDGEKASSPLKGATSSVRSVAFGPRGAWLAAAGEFDREIRLWDLQRPSTAARIVGSANTSVRALAVHPAGGVLAWGTSAGKVTLLDPERHQDEALQLGEHGADVSSLSFSGDGSVLASASVDGEVLVWRPRWQALSSWVPWRWRWSGLDPIALSGHSGAVSALASDPGRSAVAAVGADATVRIWDTQDPLADPVGLEHAGANLRALAFSPDGRTLAGGDDNGRVVLWPRTGRLLEAVCEKVWRNLTPAEWMDFVGEGIPRRCACKAYDCAEQDRAAASGPAQG